MRVKVCGMTNSDDVQAAVDFGVAAVGFVFYPKSPRYVSPKKIGKLTANIPQNVYRVGVGVNLSLSEIEEIEREARIDAWQLHGQETPEMCAQLRPRSLVKAFGLPFSGAMTDVDAYNVDAILLDKASPEYGGTGKTFDWKLAVEFKKNAIFPIILAGGLNLENIARAVKIVRPEGVDVSSGVESAPGKKDHAKMKEFIELCHRL